MLEISPPKVLSLIESWWSALPLGKLIAGLLLFFCALGVLRITLRIVRAAFERGRPGSSLVAHSAKLLIDSTFTTTLIGLALIASALLLGVDLQSSRLSVFIVLLFGVAQVAHWLTRLAETWITRSLRGPSGETPHSATGLLTFGARVSIWSLGALVLLGNAGVDITALVAGLGIGGIAVAFALQNILGDLFASLSIVLDRPFAVGDFITVDDVQGTVEQIGVKTTRIRSLSGEQILVSNSDLLKSRIRNFKRMHERRSLFRVGVTYETPHEKLKEIPKWIQQIVESQPRTRFDRAHLLAFGDSALTFEIVYFVLTPEFLVFAETQQAIHLALLNKFEAEGISFAYPTRTVYMAPLSAGNAS